MPKRKNRPHPPVAVATCAVHAGEEERKYARAISFPIFQTTNFQFRTMREFYRYLKGEPDQYLYSRYTNPTIEAAEKKMAALEGAEKALLFSSGMAAISGAILTLAQTGQELVATRTLYGGTFQLLTEILPRLGIRTRFVDTQDLEQAEKVIGRKTALFYTETPTNPNNQIVDLAQAVAIAHRRRIPVVLDNTFATPLNQRPLKFGVDVVVYSATKYLAGHSDLIAGFIVGTKKFCTRASLYRKILGGSHDPFGAWLLLRGLKTLALRVARQNRNGQAVAEFLLQHPKIRRVFYPGLPSDPGHRLAKRQMTGFTGMVCFEVSDGLKNVEKVMDRFRVILHATSLGGVESVAHIPVLTSHIQFSPAELKKADVTPGMIRLSCGIEDPGDLKADLDHALRVL